MRCCLSGSPLGHFSRLGLRLCLAHLHYSVFEGVALRADLKKSELVWECQERRRRRITRRRWGGEGGGGYLVGNDDGHDHVFEVREELQEQELEGWVQNKNYY